MVKLSVRPFSHICSEFMNGNGDKMTRMVLIVPIKIIEHEEPFTGLSWSCSMGYACWNPECIYSSGFTKRKNVSSKK